MRNELLGYLCIPVIIAGGMSVWRGLNPDKGFLPGLESMKWNKSEERLQNSKDARAAYEAEEAAEIEESEDDGEPTYADR
jgi:hypothetical protein